MQWITKLLFALTLVLLISCSDFLDAELQGAYSNETFYESEEHAQIALTGIYNTLAFSNPNNNLWVFGDVASDDAVKGGNPGDQAAIEFIDEFTYTSDNAYLQNIWVQYYEGISRANYYLEFIPAVAMDEVEKAALLGEARFLRAYLYFHLTNIFGEIPLKLEPSLTPEAIHVPVSATASIYEQIIEDLELAIEALPSGLMTSGHATKGSALGLLAKVTLFMGDHDTVLENIADLEASAGYGLMPVYAHNFQVATQNNEESIFEIQHLSGMSPRLGSSLNQWFGPQTENGYYFNAPTQDFVDEFEVTIAEVADPRLDYTIGREGATWLNGESFDPAWSPTGYLVKKHAQPLAEIPRGTKGDADLNYVYMRYAEVLLMKAEALNELGRTPEALIPLNDVRKRARESYLYDENLTGFGTVPDGLLPDLVSTNQETVRQAIRHERRVELGMEFHRYFDLMRYGANVAESALSNTEFDYATQRFFPIPQSERDINNAIN